MSRFSFIPPILPLLLILSMIDCMEGYAQFNQPKVDSLEKAIKQTEDPLQKAQLLDKLGMEYAYKDPELGKHHLRQAIALSQEAQSAKDIANSLSGLSVFYFAENKFDTIITLNQQAMDLIEGQGQVKLELIFLSVLAQAFEEKGSYGKALEYNNRVLAYPDLDTRGKMITHNNLGNLYNDLDNVDKGLSHLLLAKDYAQELDNKWGESAISTNIGHSYQELGENAKAKEYFRRAVAIKEEIGDENGKTYGLSGLGSVLMLQDSIEEAISTYKQILLIARKHGNIKSEISAQDRIGQGFMELGKTDSAILAFQTCLTLIEGNDRNRYFSQETNANIDLSKIFQNRGDLRKALQHAQQALKTTQKRDDEIEVSEVEVSALLQLSAVYQALGQSSQALETLQEYNLLKDSLDKIMNLKETKTLELKYNVSEKEKEMAVMEAQKNAEIQSQRTTNLLFGIIAGIALISATLLFLFLRQRTKQKQRLEVQHQQISEQHTTIVQQAEELQQLDSLKSRLFANVSHELRTPLTLILGPLSSALKTGNLDNKTTTFLELAQQSGQKLLQLVNEILDLSKMDAGKLELIEKPVHLSPFLQRLLAQFESHAQSKEVELHLTFQADSHLQVLLDVHKFELVFNNLLSNALKFTPKGGKVSVILEQHGNQLDMVVNDTGPGIPENDLVQVFDRFYQSSHSENQAGGTGIGLALCHEYARLFQGSVRAENLPKGGASFRFAFPLKEIPGTIEEESLVKEQKIISLPLVAKTPKQQDKHILLVEDNFSLQSYIHTVLGDHFQLTTADNGQEALDILQKQEQKIDLILSDVMMPVMDGFQLLEHLKANEVWRKIPVVMLTARAELRDKLKALRIGVDDYMTKPFNEEELVVRIQNLLEHADQRLLPPVWESEGEKKESSEAEIPESPGLSAEDQAWLEKVEVLTKNSIDNLQFGVDDLAYEMAASRRNFHRKLKRLTGLTPNNYILEVRLQQARYFLETRQLSSVKATSLEVGFRDTKYFSQKFKSRFGRLPSEYLPA